MKGKKSLYIVLIVSVMLILLGLLGSLFLNEGVTEKVVSVVTAGTAIVGALALFYQFRRDKVLNEASFLVEYSNQFYSTYKCADLMDELEKCRTIPGYQLDVDAYYKNIVGYLEWLEILATLINSGVLEIAKIDNVMGYRYFLIVNNKQIQDGELIRNRDFYHGIYTLYPIWAKYKRDRNLSIIFEENDLTQTDGFRDLLTQVEKKAKKRPGKRR